MPDRPGAADPRARAESIEGESLPARHAVAWRDGDNLIEGVVDLAFEADGKWTVVEFKTNEELTRFFELRDAGGVVWEGDGGGDGQPTAVVLMRISVDTCVDAARSCRIAPEPYRFSCRPELTGHERVPTGGRPARRTKKNRRHPIANRRRHALSVTGRRQPANAGYIQPASPAARKDYQSRGGGPIASGKCACRESRQAGRAVPTIRIGARARAHERA